MYLSKLTLSTVVGGFFGAPVAQAEKVKQRARLDTIKNIAFIVEQSNTIFFFLKSFQFLELAT